MSIYIKKLKRIHTLIPDFHLNEFSPSKKSEIKMKFYEQIFFKDLFLRVYYTEFKLPKNEKW